MPHSIASVVLVAAVLTGLSSRHDALSRPDAVITAAEDQAVADPATTFARDVTLHVVLHELGHALIREFDLPVLGNEETAADAFATWYLTNHLPDRADDVLAARVRSLLIESRDTPADDWSGEHNHDGRRAHQIAALAIAADVDAYHHVAELVGMDDDDIRRARDYGSEIHRSWRRVLRPIWMPAGESSGEMRVHVDESAQVRAFLGGLPEEVRSILGRFDWHSQITVAFVEGDGGAAWSRNRRTITVHAAYVERFVDQGREATTKPAGPSPQNP